MLVITTVEGKEYSLQAPDEVTRNEWRTALEENIRRLDPSKVATCFLSTLTIVYVLVVISSKQTYSLCRHETFVWTHVHVALYLHVQFTCSTVVCSYFYRCKFSWKYHFPLSRNNCVFIYSRFLILMHVTFDTAVICWGGILDENCPFRSFS